MSTTVTVVGNVTRDPEIRFTTNGKAVAGFGLAVTPRRRNAQTGEWEDGDTSFFNVSAWGSLGEHVAESCPKGTRVIVSGSLVQRSWEDSESGAKRSTVEITADAIGPELTWATATVVRPERAMAGAK